MPPRPDQIRIDPMVRLVIDGELAIIRADYDAKLKAIADTLIERDLEVSLRIKTLTVAIQEFEQKYDSALLVRGRKRGTE